MMVLLRHKKSISLYIGILVSGVTLYFAFRHVPFRELLQYLSVIDYGWVLPAVAATLLSLFLRGFRWRIIVGSVRPIDMRHAFHPVMIGFMLNCVMPGRVGEFARPAVLKARTGIPFTSGLATVMVERIMDLIILLAFLTLTFAMVDIDPQFQMAFGDYVLSKSTLESIFSGMLRLGIALIVGVALISFSASRAVIARMVTAAPELLVFASAGLKEKIRARVCEPVNRILDHIADGTSTMKSPGRGAVCLMLTVLIWLIQTVSYYVFAMGCPGIDLSFLEILAMVVIICFFIALPSVPGFWGLWEAGGVFALMLFGVSGKEAAGYTLTSHAIQIFPVILVGFISAWIYGINILRMAEKIEVESPRSDTVQNN